MDILLEALNNFKLTIYIDNENIIDDDYIYELEYKQYLSNILCLFEKINVFIKEIETNIDKGNISLNVRQANNYYKKYDLDHDSINQIKIIMRRIKNRYYQKASRYRKRMN